MSEIEGMSDEVLKIQIKDLESMIRREKNDFTNLNKKTMDLERRLNENRNKLKLST